MKYFADLSTRAKLLFSFGLIWLLFLAVIIIAYRGLQDITRSEKDLHDVEFMTALELQQLRSYQNFNRAAILEMGLTENKSEQLAIEKSINECSDSMNIIIESLSKLDSDPLFQSRLKELEDYLRAYRETRNEQFRLIYEGKIKEAQQLGTGIQGDRFKKIRSLAITMEKKAAKDVDGQLAADQNKAEKSMLLFLILGIFALFFSAIIIILMSPV